MSLFFSEVQYADTHITDVKALYEEAFPFDERRDFSDFLEILKNDSHFKLCIGTDCETNGFLGFISYWDFESFVYIEHFAVLSKERNQGIGRQMLKWFFGHIGSNRNIVLEVEPPVDSLTERRVNFYQSLGFSIWNSYLYIQPPYSPGRSSMELRLMTKGNLSEDELDGYARTIHSAVYGQELETVCASPQDG